MSEDKIGGEKAILEERRKKLDQLRDKGSAYGNSFKPQNKAEKLHDEYGSFSKEELAKKNKTSVVIASNNIKIAKWIGNLISTKYYLTEYSKDIIGVEICSAIKNIYAMVIGSGQNLNTSSGLFQKSMIEMKYLVK